LKKERLRLNRELKKKTTELQKKVDDIRADLSAEQCETLVMQLLHEGFVTELDKYLNTEVAKTVAAICRLWDKYHVSATELLNQREKAEDKLNGFLEGLGYLHG
jgi:type I restriction enzyme M protein